ncbi:MAG TPA: SpoIID/LytB domain-containing protein [Actinomycetota bacterium]|nr:SpoIID/LytB domain-containing protein [Actinomycetota bacterium]
MSRRIRTVAAVGALAVALGLLCGPGDAPAEAAPRTFTIVGGGYGHGIGMSQYGAHGMALRGASTGRIISYYYGGAQARPATLPATIRVGLLQANRDPSTGRRLGQVLVKGIEVPGKGGSGRFSVSGVTRGGRKVRRGLSGHTTFSIRPESGGTSVFDPSRRRVFGPTRAGTGVVVRFETALPPARLSLPQTGRQLRWGRLDVHLVRDNRGVTRPRAVAVIPFNRYLRGLAEVPGSFANEALRAQAIAARSFALVAVRTRSQHWGYGRWDGCDCAVYATVRDQNYAGYAKERGYWGSRWVAAVRGTGSLVVRYGSRVVQAFYSSSSGGYTSSNDQWGSDPLPWFPARSDDPYDRGGGAHRNPNFRWKKTVSAASLGARLGIGTATRVRETKLPSWGGRVSRVTVEGIKAGRRTSVTVTGTWFRKAYGLKSTKFHISP